MSRAVRFDRYGPVEVLRVAEVEPPTPAAGEVLVEVVSAGINPGEIAIREGLLHAQWPVGCQNPAIGADLRFQAAGSYSLISPPSIGRRLIRWYPRSGMGCSRCGGRRWSARCGLRVL
jgi:hypothetical protein